MTLVRDSSDTDQYGRALRYVETAGGVDVGAALVESGDAISRRYEPDTARSDRYDTLQGQASAAGLGQWAPDACGAPVASASITVEVHADAAGDDNDNLNDEWVRFTNAGSASGRPRRLGRRRRVGLPPLRLRQPRARPPADRSRCSPAAGAIAHTRYWCNTRSAVWNNSGDTVFLRDPSGNNVVVHGY